MRTSDPFARGKSTQLTTLHVSTQHALLLSSSLHHLDIPKSCKPDRFEYFTTTMMEPRLNNSRVVWAFSGVDGVTNDGGTDRFQCLAPEMIPKVVSLDASWGFGTAFGFDLAADMPRALDYPYYYYAFNLPLLRNRIASQYSEVDRKSIIFRAEYVCDCPGTS